MSAHGTTEPQPSTARRRRIGALVTAVLGIASVTAGVSSGPRVAEAATLTWSADVIRVIDGDTFEARIVGSSSITTIRVAGLNTNERWFDEPIPAECHSYAASNALEDLIGGRRVRLEARSASSVDKGRDLRHVFLGSDNIAETMLEQGMGVPIRFTAEPDHSTANTAAAWSAARSGLGIWDSDACGSGPSAANVIEFVTNYDAAGNDTTNVRGEFVQIRNRGTTTIDLTGWQLRDSGLSRWTFPAGRQLAPNGRLRVHVGSGTDIASDIYMDRSGAMLSNTADGMFLHDPDFDIRAFDMWPCHPGCGEAPPLVIDHVQFDAPGNDGSNPNGEWIRIRNVGTSTVDFQDWQIDSPPYQLNSIASRPIAPGRWLTVFVGSGSNTRSSMYLGRSNGVLGNSGDQVRLLSPHRDVVDCHAWGTARCSKGDELGSRLQMTMNWDAAGNDLNNPNGEWVNVTNRALTSINVSGFRLSSPPHSYTFPSGTVIAAGARLRVRVGVGNNTTTTKYWGKSAPIFGNSGDGVRLLTPSGRLVQAIDYPCVGAACGPAPDRLVIDDVSYNAPGDDLQNPNGEWIRVRNASFETVDLRDWQILSPPYQINPAASRRLGPGDSVTIFVGQGTSNAGRIYWGKTRGILGNTGDLVMLLDPARRLADCAAWGSKQCPSGLPIAATTVLSAQFDAEGDDSINPNGEWINISNTGSAPLDLAGFTVYSSSRLLTLGSGSLVQPGERLRVHSGTGSNTRLTKYVGRSSGALANSGGSVGLFDPSGNEVRTWTWPCDEPCDPSATARISQVVWDAPGDDTTNPNGERVRIQNSGTVSLDLRDWSIVSPPYVYDFDSSDLLAPGGQLEVRIGSGSDSAQVRYWGRSSSILANSGDLVRLVAPSGHVTSCQSWGSASC